MALRPPSAEMNHVTRVSYTTFLHMVQPPLLAAREPFGAEMFMSS